MINQELFLQIDSLYQNCFGDVSVPTDTLRSWFRAQPNGIIPLIKNQELLGALSYWYLSEASYRGLSTGKLSEKDIVVKEIDMNQFNYIYISEIALATQFRGKGMSIELVSRFFRQIAKEYLWNEPLKITALGYSKEGIAILFKMGLRQILGAEQSVNKQPFMEMKVKSSKELLQLFD